MTVVHLDPWELALAAKIGVARRAFALANGLARDRFPTSRTGVWDADVEGAAAELAVAKVLDRYWDGYVGPTTPHRPDVGPIEVRWTGRDAAELIIRPGDPDDAPYVLVAGRAPTVDVVGYLPRAQDGKRVEWLRDDGGWPAAYFVPRSALRPVEELRR